MLLALGLLLAGCAGRPAGGPAQPELTGYPAPQPGMPPLGPPLPLPGLPGEPRWLYRIGGDRAVRPAQVTDNGRQTAILFPPDQALPAVFAIGPTGDEEVVNGYMRGEAYVIDRVYERLVFRIDEARATARRADEPVEP